MRFTIPLLLCWSVRLFAATVPTFPGVQVLKVQDSGGVDLSGLAWCEGGLYAVADKVDDRIYRIVLDGAGAALRSAVQLPPIPSRSASYALPVQFSYWYHWLQAGDVFDWEDIACTGPSIYLLSERKNGIVKVSGGRAEWLAAAWYEPLHQQGYLNRYNAFVEGLAVLDEAHMLVAMEREPRGIIRLTRDAQQRWQVRSAALGDEQRLEFRAGNPDVTALQVRGTYLYTLERNASAICRRDLEQLRAASCYSFAAIENDGRYRYLDTRYGKAEGMALDERWIYVILDNNDVGFAHDATDRRALLLQIPLPEPWRN